MRSAVKSPFTCADSMFLSLLSVYYYSRTYGKLLALERMAAPVSAADIDEWSDDLDQLHQRIASRFGREEVRTRSLRFLAGLLGRVERKNGWQLAGHVGGRK